MTRPTSSSSLRRDFSARASPDTMVIRTAQPSGACRERERGGGGGGGGEREREIVLVFYFNREGEKKTARSEGSERKTNL